MLAFMSLSMPIFAADNAKPKDDTGNKPVSKAFLNYLAELVEADGKLVHPTELAGQDKTSSSQITKTNETEKSEIKKTKPADKEEEK